MIRTVVNIDAKKCDGCGACAEACHEGAIALVDGKARLVRDDYCDGMGDCLPACPAGAITFVEREAAAYDEAAVLAAKAEKPAAGQPAASVLGATPQVFAWQGAPTQAAAPSCLRQWPVQIKLVPVGAPWFDGAHLLVAADCTAFACADFHRDFMDGRAVVVGCPKLDAVDYAQKLGQILQAHDVLDVTVARMEVPCCGGIEQAARRAIEASGKAVPLRVVTIATDGRVLGR
jgi:NAD-dependent dihydropyrimidine dehydrogenase PreA subunit